MKALKCEMCESTDIIKQDGFYVCQHCGTKYSVEEAKKLMIDGVVDVSGSTVKIDKTEDIENWYILARRAKDTGDSANAHMYYSMINAKKPNDWEAYFFSHLCKAQQCRVGEIKSAAEQLKQIIEPTYLLIANHIKDKKEQIIAVNQVIVCGCELATNMFYSAVDISSDVNYKLNQRSACIFLVLSIGNVYVYFNDDDICKLAVPAWKLFIQLKDIAYGKNATPDKFTIERIQKYEPGYVYKKPTSTSSSNYSSSSSGGCYVATCVYGSYNCPQVWTLRRFRDNTLANSWYGRTFIHMYYMISPTIVKWFGDTQWFKNMWKGTLDNIVKNLQNKGYESTPYNDREW